MCDTEHMFDCPNTSGTFVDDPMDSIDEMEFNRFIQQTMKVDYIHKLTNIYVYMFELFNILQVNPSFQHKNLVAKKFHLYDKVISK